MGQKTTIIRQIINEDNDPKTGYLLFVVIENASKNRYLSPGSYTEVDGPVPWCSNHDEFLKKGIIITNRFKATVLGCIWQDQDHVRLGKSGWDPASETNKMPGHSAAGGSIDLKIDKQGNISAVKVQDMKAGEEREIPAEQAR